MRIENTEQIKDDVINEDVDGENLETEQDQPSKTEQDHPIKTWESAKKGKGTKMSSTRYILQPKQLARKYNSSSQKRRKPVDRPKKVDIATTSQPQKLLKKSLMKS